MFWGSISKGILVEASKNPLSFVIESIMFQKKKVKTKRSCDAHSNSNWSKMKNNSLNPPAKDYL